MCYLCVVELLISQEYSRLEVSKVHRVRQNLICTELLSTQDCKTRFVFQTEIVLEYVERKLNFESDLNLELKLKIGVSCKTKEHDVMSCSWRVGCPIEEDRLTAKDLTYSSAAAAESPVDDFPLAG